MTRSSFLFVWMMLLSILMPPSLAMAAEEYSFTGPLFQERLYWRMVEKSGEPEYRPGEASCDRTFTRSIEGLQCSRTCTWQNSQVGTRANVFSCTLTGTGTTWIPVPRDHLTFTTRDPAVVQALVSFIDHEWRETPWQLEITSVAMRRNRDDSSPVGELACYRPMGASSTVLPYCSIVQSVDF